MNLFIGQNETHRLREQTDGCRRGGGAGTGGRDG